MIGSPNALGTLAGLQDSLARLAGVGGISDLHADRQLVLNGFLELALEEFWNESDWTWGRVEGAALEAKTLYSTGTISLTAGQGAVTGAGTNWVDGTNLDILRSHISLGDGKAMHQISAIGGVTDLTVVPTLGGTTDLSGDAYEAGTPDYELAADVWGLLQLQEVYEGGNLLKIETYEQWLARTAGIWETGRPTHCVLLSAAGDALGPNQAVRLWPVPDDNYRYIYNYYKVPTWPTTDVDSAPQTLAPLIYKALELRDLHLGQFDSATAWEKRYNVAVIKAKRRDVIRSPKVRHRMAPAWGGNVDYSDMQIIDDDTGTSDS